MTTPEQQAEIDKYEKAYQHPNYRMGLGRKTDAVAALKQCPGKSYLDVGCGRGEMLEIAKGQGFETTRGVESCPSLVGGEVIEALAWDLPFDSRSFDVVSCLDVIEHILPGDDEKVVRELNRVAKSAIIITANNKTSRSLGMELHVNRRPYAMWDELFRKWTCIDVEWMTQSKDVVSHLWIMRK